VVISILFVLGNIERIALSKSYMGIVYSTLLGLFIVASNDVLSGTLIAHLFVRNIIAFPLMIITIGFVVNRKQMLISGVIIAILFPAILLASNIKELVEITPFVTLMILISTFAMNIFLSSMEKSIERSQHSENELLKQKIILEVANKDKDTLLSLISHDLIGPICATKQTVRYILDDSPDEKDKNYLLNIVDSSMESTFQLLNNLLLWGRNKQGVLLFEPTHLNVNLSVSKSVQLFNIQAKQKSINIVNNIDPSVFSFSDEDLFETIVRNLLANAIKFTNENGNITISCITNNTTYSISIKDDGVGIPEKKIDKIFVDFKGMSTHGTNDEKGSGLGLKLCKEFAEKNGGKIWVQSEVGKGSEFVFTIPKSRNYESEETTLHQDQLEVSALS
jgi:signal transduction histidine kinase